MNRSMKFFGVVLLIAKLDMVFSADAPSLTLGDLDRYNATLRDRLATIRATLPEETVEIKELEMRLKVGGVWPERAIASATVSKRRSSLTGAIYLERERLMPFYSVIEDLYAKLVTQFEMRILAQNRLEEITAGIAIAHEDTPRTSGIIQGSAFADVAFAYLYCFDFCARMP